MEYRIIGDSCLDLTPEMKKEGKIKIVSLTLQVDGVDFIDDDSFDRKSLLKRWQILKDVRSPVVRRRKSIKRRLAKRGNRLLCHFICGVERFL